MIDYGAELSFYHYLVLNLPTPKGWKAELT